MRVLGIGGVVVLMVMMVNIGKVKAENLETDDVSNRTHLLGLLLITAMILIVFLATYSLRQSRFPFLHETGSTILIGMCVGAASRLTASEELLDMIRFKSEYFFWFLLPVIIFESGYSMKRRYFFINMVPICMYAFVGTAVTAFVIGIIVWGLGQLWLDNLTLVQSLTFGSLISATDTVTIIAIVTHMKVDVNLNAYIFGESALNDAVAIVLYRTVIQFQSQPVTFFTISFAIGECLVIFLGSLLIGVLCGVASALLLKHTNLYKHTTLEFVLVVMYAYLSYLLAEVFYLSGIISILFCGIIMAHYTQNNLTEMSRHMMSDFFRVIAFFAENIAMALLGMAIFLYPKKFDYIFIVVALLACLIARACSIFPLTALMNATRSAERQIPLNHQLVLWYSGLRGVIAFSLALDAEYKLFAFGDIFFTATLIIILITVVIFGGLAHSFVHLVKVKIDVDPEVKIPFYEKITNESKIMHIDRTIIKPFLTHRTADLRASIHPSDLEDSHFPPPDLTLSNFHPSSSLSSLPHSSHESRNHLANPGHSASHSLLVHE